MTLSGKQRRSLRQLGHHLRPVVQVGKGGLDAGLVQATQDALARHELVKVKLPEDQERGDRQDMAQALAAATRSELAQVLGRTALYYKERAKEPQIQLPRAAPAVGDVQAPRGPAPHTKGPSQKPPGRKLRKRRVRRVKAKSGS